MCIWIASSSGPRSSTPCRTVINTNSVEYGHQEGLRLLFCKQSNVTNAQCIWRILMKGYNFSDRCPGKDSSKLVFDEINASNVLQKPHLGSHSWEWTWKECQGWSSQLAVSMPLLVAHPTHSYWHGMTWISDYVSQVLLSFPQNAGSKHTSWRKPFEILSTSSLNWKSPFLHAWSVSSTPPTAATEACPARVMIWWK